MLDVLYLKIHTVDLTLDLNEQALDGYIVKILVKEFRNNIQVQGIINQSMKFYINLWIIQYM